MFGQTESELEQEQSLINAVRKLRAHQHQQLEAIQLLDSAREVIQHAGERLREAEYLVAQSEILVSQKNVVLLDCSQFFKELEVIGIGINEELERARLQLWSVESEENDAILEAARVYGLATRAFNAHYPKQMAAVDAIRIAIKDLERVKGEHAVRVARQEAARQVLRNAHDQFGILSDRAHAHREIFELEKAVVDLAHRLTGTEDMKIQYDCVDTKDLPITLLTK